MEFLELTLLLLAAVLASAVLDQVVPKVTSPLIQIALGILIALFAGNAIDIEFNPELFLVIFIAPLLYNEAQEADKGSLWAHIKPVLSLAIGLVLATALLVGAFVHALIPTIPLTAAIALGAALGPTDAVAVASLPKNLSIGQRERSILKGECLINDASGIVTFQFAAAAYATGAFSLGSATEAFAISFFGGLLIGAIMGILSSLLLAGARTLGVDNTTFHVLFDVFTPFIVFLAAEPFGASGVIAVVVAGLVSTMGKRRVGPSVSRLNIVSSSVWRVISYALNGIVFVLLGTQLPKAMRSSWDNVTLDNAMLVAFVLLIALAVVLIRFVWLLGIEVCSLPRGKRLASLGKDQVRNALIMTLAGPKGTVTLSIAFSLPILTAIGSYFPQRQLIIFLASGVILVTLLLANFVIPLLCPRKQQKEEEQARKVAENEAIVEILRSVVEGLAAHQTPQTHRATQRVIRSYNDRIARTKLEEDEDALMIDLRIRLIHWEQDYIQDALTANDEDPYVVHKLLCSLARRENYLRRGPRSATLHARVTRWKLFAHSAFRRMVDGLPFISLKERSSAEYDLSRRAIQHGNEKLQELLQDSGDIPTEYVSTLLVESTRTLQSMRAQTPSISTYAATENVADEIQRYGLSLELEGIQSMYEEGRINRACAKRLRENVALMQIDLEGKV